MLGPIKKALRGETPFDLVIVNAQMVNVYTQEIYLADMGISQGVFAYIAKAGTETLEGPTINAEASYMVPGFIDCHMHLESTMLTPANFTRTALPCGTTTVVVDPHEIANVLGVLGIQYMLDASSDLPLDFFVQIPSCVPAVVGLDTSGAILHLSDAEAFFSHTRVKGLGEVMDFKGVIQEDPRMRDLLEKAREHKQIISGHAPLVTKRDLASYLVSGPTSCHETITEEEVLEKLRSGMVVEGRGSSHSENISLLSRVLKKLPTLPPNTVLCTDDVFPTDLLARGHMNASIRLAIKEGINEVWAICMATLHGALRFRLYDRGAIAPGLRADFSLLPSLKDCNPTQVFVKGKLVAKDKECLVELPTRIHPVEEKNTMDIKDLTLKDLEFRYEEKGTKATIHGMRIGDAPLLTEYEKIEVQVANEQVLLPLEEDLCYAIVIERHGHKGALGKTIIRGIGLREGALGSTIAHDSHNLLLVGKSLPDMLQAAQTLIESGGGVTYVANGETKALLPLEVAGLMSKKQAKDVASLLANLQDHLRNAGVVGKNPLMSFVALALPVIPHVRITDQGLVDVNTQSLYPLFAP